MGTVYVTQEDAFIGKTDERLTVKFDKKLLLDVPLIKVDGVVILGRVTVSPAVISALLERHIPLTFLGEYGKYLGCLEPELSKNIFLRKAQWSWVGETVRSVHLVRSFIRGKLKNYRTSLMRRSRECSELNLSVSIDRLGGIIEGLEGSEKIESLRGFEGSGSKIYFGCFSRLLKNDLFDFQKRVRRPPTDPVNALLSLGYSLLTHDVKSAVNLVGFDPYLGYLHYDRYGRPSLALDLMEEFRPLVVDAVVLRVINTGLLSPDHFVSDPLNHAVSLTKDGLRIFLSAYQEKKLSKFSHPVLQVQKTYQESFEVQARLMAKYLLGEIDKYTPLILK